MRPLSALLPALCCLFALPTVNAWGQGGAQTAAPTASSAAKNSLSPIVVYNPANNHFYQSFGGSLPWEEAAKKASEQTYHGVKGHLATVTSQQEYDFVVNNLWVYDYWLGGYRDPNRLTDASDHGWRWVTGEPFVYANWNDGQPTDKELKPHALASWTGSLKWSPHMPTDGVAGYLVEYDNTASVPKSQATTAGAEIDKFLEGVSSRYAKMTSYQATVEFTFKDFYDTLQNVKANLMLLPDGRFRLDGRGENGKLLAISDGNRLMLSTIAPGERMKFVVKPMPPLAKALREAFSLLTSSPKPPSITDLMTGGFDKQIFTARGISGEVTPDEHPEQAIRTHTRVKLSGENPENGDLRLAVSLEQGVFTSSELTFRFKLNQYTVRETHSDIKLNEPIADNNFVLVITTNARQVDDLGEHDDSGLTFSVPSK